MAADKIEAKGLAISFPVACGNEPCMGSKSAFFSPIEEEANKPIDPPITLASSEIISPKRFSVRMTSNCFGFKIICMAALSTKRNSKVTSLYSLAISVTVFLHKRDVSNTFALSTKVIFFRLFCAALKARCVILEISVTEYEQPSNATVPSSLNSFIPK